MVPTIAVAAGDAYPGSSASDYRTFWIEAAAGRWSAMVPTAMEMTDINMRTKASNRRELFTPMRCL
jgi:hypothetical protein